MTDGEIIQSIVTRIRESEKKQNKLFDACVYEGVARSDKIYDLETIPFEKLSYGEIGFNEYGWIFVKRGHDRLEVLDATNKTKEEINYDTMSDFDYERTNRELNVTLSRVDVLKMQVVPTGVKL